MEVGTGISIKKKRVLKYKPVYLLLTFAAHLLNEITIKEMFEYYVSWSAPDGVKAALVIEKISFTIDTLLLKFSGDYLNRDAIKLINAILADFFNPKHMPFGFSTVQKIPDGIAFQPIMMEGVTPILRNKDAITECRKKHKACWDEIIAVTTHAPVPARKRGYRWKSLDLVRDSLRKVVGHVPSDVVPVCEVSVSVPASTIAAATGPTTDAPIIADQSTNAVVVPVIKNIKYTVNWPS